MRRVLRPGGYLVFTTHGLQSIAVHATTGQRPLDIFSVHYYPQGGEFGNDVSTLTQALRNHSTRSLWDPNYADESWINDRVQLIPRLRNWVNTYYFSDTKIAITEYNWGAESHINGATSQSRLACLSVSTTRLRFQAW